MSEIGTATHLGIITGLQKEAACLKQARRTKSAAGRDKTGNPRPFQLTTAVVAGQAQVAAEAARRMVADGVTGLVSFGIAGGLDPSLGPGVMVVASAVSDREGRTFPCDENWLNRLLQSASVFDSGTILGSDQAILTVGEKQKLFRSTGALAVDMESHAVAEVAQRAGLPFVAIRAVGDPANRAIPLAALAGLAPDGRTRALPVLAGLLRRPADIPAIWRLAKDTNIALKSLSANAATIVGCLTE